MTLRLVPGTTFANDYRVVQPLSRGGMGAVFVVEQRSTGARRALKLMLPHLAGDDEARARFEREAQVGSRIASDHVVQVLAAGVDEATGTPWLVMELLEGESLDARVRRSGPVSHGDARTLFAQLGHAVGSAHAAGVVHRDLKPENLHLGEGRRAGEPLTLKVLDFGIAKLTLEAGTTATAPIGTLAWMAPEQAEVDARVSPATDVWAIGLIAFWALTGHAFWKAAAGAGSPTALLKELLVDDLPRATDRAQELGVSGLPVAFDAWFARAVARDPSARYQDGGEACRELVRLLGPDAAIDETIDARALASSPREASTSPQRAPITDVRPRTHGSLRAVAAVAALVVLLAVGLRFWPRGGALPEAPTSSAVPSASAAPPTPVVITSLPRPACAHPKVISLYASALQDFRDANWDHATARLGEAAELEPGCAAVQLRLAMTQSGDEARATYQRALEHRTDLDPRDRALLDAWEPLTHDPPDARAAAARLRAAAEARPEDAELWTLVCAREPADAQAAAAACRRAIELDPLYADAWQCLAVKLGDLGQHAEEEKALDHCIELSATSIDCRTGRATLRWEAARCDPAIEDLRVAVSLNPKSKDLRHEWCRFLAMQDRPHDTLLQALQDRWALYGDDRPIVEARDRLVLALDEERSEEFELQRKTLAELSIRHPLDPEAEIDLATRSLQFLLERERFAEAADVAESYVKRRDARTGEVSGAADMMFNYAIKRAGRIDASEYESRRRAARAWARRQVPNDPWFEWRVAFHWLEDAGEAELAYAAMPKGEPPPDYRFFAGECMVYTHHGADALKLLDGRVCMRRPSVRRALALDDAGRTEEACAEYRAVLDRLGTDPSPPAWAKQARARVAARHCAPAPARAK